MQENPAEDVTKQVFQWSQALVDTSFQWTQALVDTRLKWTQAWQQQSWEKQVGV